MLAPEKRRVAERAAR